jgi:hypothetical protein
VGRDVAVAVGVDAHINAAVGHIVQTAAQGPTIVGDVVLHGDDVMAKLAQHSVDVLTVVAQVTIGGGDLDPDHVAPSGRLAFEPASHQNERTVVDTTLLHQPGDHPGSQAQFATLAVLGS